MTLLLTSWLSSLSLNFGWGKLVGFAILMIAPSLSLFLSSLALFTHPRTSSSLGQVDRLSSLWPCNRSARVHSIYYTWKTWEQTVVSGWWVKWLKLNVEKRDAHASLKQESNGNPSMKPKAKLNILLLINYRCRTNPFYRNSEYFIIHDFWIGIVWNADYVFLQCNDTRYYQKLYDVIKSNYFDYSVLFFYSVMWCKWFFIPIRKFIGNSIWK